MGEAMGGNATQRPLIRRTLDASSSASPSSSSAGDPPLPVFRRTGGPQGDRSTGGVLRRTSQPASGAVLQRTGPRPPPGVLQRTRAPGQGQGQRQRDGRMQGQGQGQRDGRMQGQGQRDGRGPPGARGGPPAPDKRRRKVANTDFDAGEDEAAEAAADEFTAKYVNPPMNPTEPSPYNPQNLTLDDLRADWPNTALSTAGIAESVVQKVEYLARRLPHGYMTPEYIAERYLKGNLVRFETEAEKQEVLKIAAEKSAQTKRETDEGTLHKHRKPTYPAVADPSFESMASKSGDKSYLIDTNVKGDYGVVSKQRYPFMQNVAQALYNNDSYGPVQSQKLLDRIQSLIPQAKPTGTQAAKKA